MMTSVASSAKANLGDIQMHFALADPAEALGLGDDDDSHDSDIGTPVNAYAV
jgi:hypothetical protein